MREDHGESSSVTGSAAEAPGCVIPTGTRSPLVSIIIPVLDDAAGLRRCLASVRRSAYPEDRIEIIVADNGSTDASAEVARAHGADVLELPGLPVSELRNRAASVARGSVLAFVDADHEIAAGWLRSAVESLQGPGVGAAGDHYHAPLDGTWVQRTYDGFRERSEAVRDTEWLCSGNLAVRRDAFERTGGFDSSLDTCEDVDFCQRLRSTGFRILSDPRLRSVHFGDPATLAALFRGELWRGRDNLRASLRSPITLRGLPSVLVPVLDLGLVGIVATGLLTVEIGGLWFAAAAVLLAAGMASLRAARMLSHPGKMTLQRVAQVMAVASVYDAARALALVVRATHRTRRQAEVV